MDAPCAVSLTDYSGSPASCCSGRGCSTLTTARRQRRRSEPSLSSTGSGHPFAPTDSRQSAARQCCPGGRGAAPAPAGAARPGRREHGATLDGPQGILHAGTQRRSSNHWSLTAGRKSHEVRRFYASFRYQAQSWSRSRRVVAKVEWHPGELYPRVGFLVTNLCRPPERVVAFYNQRGTAEQWIKEGKNAAKW